MTDWTTLAAGLADELVRLGKVRSPEWQAAVRAVPRHELVPVQHLYDPSTGTWTPRSTADDLALVYSNTALFVLPGGRSSTSMPGLMTRMLETLDVRDGHDVLEIGTGTGYNAALLSHRIGDQHVFSVDIEPDLVQLARERLARIGYRPPWSPLMVWTACPSTRPTTGSSAPVRFRPCRGRGSSRSARAA
ncbi:MAG TPA: methyltransferase domain-containing protein [Pseudonocardiaceae bacterium]|nr:methyltransferase domain-containing protein [Pseudonocardiaceae bacterium]